MPVLPYLATSCLLLVSQEQEEYDCRRCVSLTQVHTSKVLEFGVGRNAYGTYLQNDQQPTLMLITMSYRGCGAWMLMMFMSLNVGA